MIEFIVVVICFNVVLYAVGRYCLWHNRRYYDRKLNEAMSEKKAMREMYVRDRK